MGDSLSILLQAELDSKNSLNKINSQIKTLSRGLEKLKVSINFDDGVLKQLNDQIAQITKNLGGTAKVNVDTSGVSGFNNAVQNAKKNLISLTQTTTFNTKTGQQFTAITEKVRELDNSITTLRYNSKGQLVSESVTNNIEKNQKAMEKLNFTISEFKKNMNFKLDKMFDMGKIDSSQLETLKNRVAQISSSTPNAQQAMVSLRNEINRLNQTATNSSSGLQQMMSLFANVTGVYSWIQALNMARSAVKEMVGDSLELDTAMINLQRVTSESASTYENFANSAFKTVDKIGGSASALVDSTTEFAKLGYTFEEAGKLAEAASKYSTAGDLSVETATKNISAAFTVYKDQLTDVNEIIDLYNAIGGHNCLAVWKHAEWRHI